MEGDVGCRSAQDEQNVVENLGSIVEPDEMSEAPRLRERLLTERGKEWHLNVLSGKFRDCERKWRKQLSNCLTLFADSNNCEELRSSRERLVSPFDNLTDITGALEQFDEAEVAVFRSKYESLEGECTKNLANFSEIIRSLDIEQGSNQSSKSSRHSFSLRPSSVKASIAAEAASLRVKLKFIELEAQRRADLERIETMKLLEMATARAEAMEAVETNAVSDLERLPQINVRNYVQDFVMDQQSSPTVQEPNVDAVRFPAVATSVHSPLSPFAPSFAPVAATAEPSNGADPVGVLQPPSVNQGWADFAKFLVDQISLNRLPPPEPNVFNGDPIQFPAWKSAFNLLIDQKNIPVSERLHYLKRYLGSTVRQVIENYFLVPSDKAYEEARTLLEERYGDPFLVSSAFRERLDKWPRIQSRDAIGLVKFSDFLKQCLMAMQSIPSLRILDDCQENRKMLSKLPDWVVVRWNRIVASHKETHKEFPPFSHFVDFIAKEAKVASDPVTSVLSLRDKHVSENQSLSSLNPSKTTHPSVSRPHPRSFLSSSQEGGNRYKPFSTFKSEACVFCQGQHGLDKCKPFLERSMEERKEFIKKNGFCFGCLRTGHVSKKCKQRLSCVVCSKLHPTCLHGDKLKPKTDIKAVVSAPMVSLSTSCTSGLVSKCSAIVPVYVSHYLNPDNEKLVYALLDTQSDTTFILQDTCKALGVSGTSVSLSLSTMSAEEIVVASEKVNGLLVRGYNSCKRIKLPNAYTRNIMPANRSHIPTPETARAWSHLEELGSKLIDLQDCDIGLLIGYDCPQALLPREVIPAADQGPFGQRTDLGWSIVGVVQQSKSDEDNIGLSHHILACEVPSVLATQRNTCANSVLFSLRTSVKEVVSNDVLHLLELDFKEPESDDTQMSQEDRQFLSLLTKHISFSDGKYKMPLPFKHGNPVLPNNRGSSLSRLESLRKRLLSGATFRSHYFDFMNSLVKNGYAERVLEKKAEGPVWYLPHHGVYHPQKPDKIRVVFDCSAVCQGHSLNQHLLQGPDLTNKLVGVLCRFRKEPVAFMCDLEQMFYQFGVTTECRDYLRFLWWDTPDISSDPVDFRMTVHLFGASSSPGCANFGLKTLAKDFGPIYGGDVAKFISQDFYVDDGLMSLPTVDQTIDLIDRTRALFSQAKMRLHKFVSNSKDVIQAVPIEDRAKDLQNVDILHDKLPVEKALGIWWCVESDTFQFKIVLKERPLTRRGLLSTVGCLYDPLGFIAPVVLQGKQILQQMCSDKAEWDDPLPEHLRSKWCKWLEDLKNLSSLKIARCWKPCDFGEITSVELHHFSDASFIGYGQCSYIRLVNQAGDVHCALVMGKSRVAPLKPVTIPRLELVAALLSVKVGSLLQKELAFCHVRHVYWTDSKVVLGYINNESRRFHVFVANRVQQIRNCTEPSQWNYVTTDENPADKASRGVSVNELVENPIWFIGPDFLWQRELSCNHVKVDIDSSDPNLKKSHCFAMVQQHESRFASLSERLSYLSSWLRAKRALALCLRYVAKLRQLAAKGSDNPSSKSFRQDDSVSVSELVAAETVICRIAQKEGFSEDINHLNRYSVVGFSAERKELTRRHSVLKTGSKLRQLDPFIDSCGLIRIAGRLGNSGLDSNLKHPIVLPRKGHLTMLLARHCHERCLHQGRGLTVNEIRQSGFWIVGCCGLVKSLISKCVVCRRLRAPTSEQKMSVLPSDRLESTPPFSFCAADCFGPFYIREGRKDLKRYGVLFTCMSCRAVHVETINSLDTSSFINALRRFIAIRGPLRQLRCDQGTNFVGAENELKKALSEMDQDKIKGFLLHTGCDLIPFKMNVPSASHMGGVWERQIRSVRNVFAYLLLTHGSQLDDECLRTFLHEAAAIINSRPLTVDHLNDPLSVTPLNPNQLLTLKSKVILPPPGNFVKEDVYCRKRWRRTQYLLEQFWSRWKSEFLQNLQVRSKWFSPKRNMTVGDVVLLKDDNLPRNQWRLCRVVDTSVDEDGLVRKVKLAVATSDLDNVGKRKRVPIILDRPVHKLVLLCESEEEAQ